MNNPINFVSISLPCEKFEVILTRVGSSKVAVVRYCSELQF